MRARWMCGKCLAGMLVVAAGAVGTAVGQVQARPGPTRGVSVEEDSAANTPTGRRIIVAIGIDQYKNWPKLGTAVSDATAFSQLLVDKFGFQEIEKPLIDGAATRSNIMSLVDDRLRKPNLKEDDDVIFFFAGHGTTRTDEVRGRRSSRGTWFRWRRRLPARRNSGAITYRWISCWRRSPGFRRSTFW
ncbi:MAG: caspase family protein [Acidobacteriaceae bacterium]